MNDELFQGYEIKEENGEYKIILQLKPFNEEFTSELGVIIKNKKNNLKESASSFVKTHLPKIKKASVIIMAGTVLLTIFPLEKAHAHEANFNMTYLYFGNSQTYISQVDRTKGNLNLVSPSYFDLNTDGSLKITTQFDSKFVDEMHKRGIKVVPFLSNHWDRNIGRAALHNREKLAEQIADFIVKNNLDGVQVDIENVTDIDQGNYTELVRLLREKIPKQKEVSVAVAANPNSWTKGWHGSYNYNELAKYASYLMIMAYDESYPGGPEGPVASYPWVERSIQYAINQGVPKEKIVLGLPFYGRYWKEGAATGGDGISNRRVDEMLAKYGGTVVFDEKSKSPKATITIKDGDPTTVIAGKTLGPGTYHIWFENSESIKAKIDLVHKYNIKGTGSWSLGQENPVIWEDYKVWMTTHGGSTPTKEATLPVNEQEDAKTLYPTYTVKSGDTLWKIATQFGLTTTQLKQYNYLSSDMIYVGQVLYVVPSPTQTPVTAPTATNETKVEPVPVKPPTTVATKTTPAPTPAPAPKTVTTPTVKKETLVGKIMVPKASKTAMRSGTSSTNKIVKYLSTKDEVKITQEYTDKKGAKWVKVQNKSTTGWVLYSQLKSKPIPIPTLKYGSKGTAVTDLQNKLRKTGHYKKTANGKFDSTTKTAVINFQKKYKLKADGIAGPQTITKLNSVLGMK
ncbi:glycosyl hydrolase family 18 protein [Bacillus massilinigeriensis]|uniref:glycosyl hydrolase family 18 protein n=1 Tax=Bacillus massilionigeriensis TaxID=1805475 RepID=UPI00096B67B7|nr:glycosyl hydrolase family 18 protein [Bacillus massilionigeriensis]